MSLPLTRRPTRLSVCIATYHRPKLLRRCVLSLLDQTYPPDEIIVSNGGTDQETVDVLNQLQTNFRNIPIRHCPTKRSALPWQRWWGFLNSSGDIILFIDDDLEMAVVAMENLISVYLRENFQLAGVGILATTRTEGGFSREKESFKEWWLQTRSFSDGAVTPGGQGVMATSTNSTSDVIQVERMFCGGMSFPREVLEKIGPLENLYKLYDHRIGKGEDGVLSNLASRYGKLLLLTGPLAYHPPSDESVTTAYPTVGYRRGIIGTWGLANTMRWIARDRAAYRMAWLRTASLELGRGLSQILRWPRRKASWFRLAGGIVGLCKSIWNWSRIPDHAYETNDRPPAPSREGSPFVPTEGFPLTSPSFSVQPSRHHDRTR